MIGDILQPTHLIFILIVALVVLGPKRLPEVGRSLGRGLRDFKYALSTESPEHEHEYSPSPEPHPISQPVHEAPASEAAAEAPVGNGAQSPASGEAGPAPAPATSRPAEHSS